MSASSATGAPLLRKSSLGVSLVTPTGQATGEVLVNEVFPGQTGHRIGIRPRDRIVSVAGSAVTSNQQVIAYAGSLREGQSIDVTVSRGGRTLRLKGKAFPRALEHHENARTDYGAVAFRGGRLRDIFVAPRTPGGPVVFLMQGYSCATIEPALASHPYRALGSALVARGIGYYRVEKPGVGDSENGSPCAEIDFETEVAAYEAAYEHLTTVRGVSADSVFMFGHSLGGMQAPLIAVRKPPRGVAVFGTVLRNWADYHYDVDAFQSYLIAGDDPAASVEAAERNRDLFRRFYFERQSPRQIAAERPEYAQVMRSLFGWDGDQRTFGRSYRFNQDLAHLPLMAAWRDARTNVLAIYGESDLVALNGQDHRLIADVAEFERPGTGSFIEIPATSHAMEVVGNPQDFRTHVMANGSSPSGDFNPEVANALGDWIEAAMLTTPVRLKTFPARRPAQQSDDPQ